MPTHETVHGVPHRIIRAASSQSTPQEGERALHETGEEMEGKADGDRNKVERGPKLAGCFGDEGRKSVEEAANGDNSAD